MNSKYFKTKKSLIGFIIAVILIQAVIIFFTVFMIKESKIIPKEELKSADIVVAFTEYHSGVPRFSPEFSVFADGKEFVFSTASGENYSFRDLNNSIFEGDELSILYYEEVTIFGTENVVVDAHSGEMVYRSYESYAGEDPVFLPVVVAVMLELIFFIVVFLKFYLLKRGFVGSYVPINLFY